MRQRCVRSHSCASGEGSLVYWLKAVSAERTKWTVPALSAAAPDAGAQVSARVASRVASRDLRGPGRSLARPRKPDAPGERAAEPVPSIRLIDLSLLGKTKPTQTSPNLLIPKQASSPGLQRCGG